TVLTQALTDGDQVLEIGPGRIATERMVPDHLFGAARYTAIDIRRLQHHAALVAPDRFVAADVCRMPFADQSFDVIACNNVLPFVSDYRPALQELHRCLKRSGVLLVTTHCVSGQPTCSTAEDRASPRARSDAWYAENATDWVFGDDLREIMRGVGLELCCHDLFGCEPTENLLRLGLKSPSTMMLAFRDVEAASRFGIGSCWRPRPLSVDDV
ncbi:MAG: class I SAM-dependent methyltransferase, partial [Gammaproteobacteria bacterium]|nr:class I SAM-dependent methyltransferase [Gammaproteobacteria bacterium]